MTSGGYGATPYGGGPYGGSLVDLSGEEFDVFCIRDLDMFQILVNPDVDYTPVDAQYYTPNASTLDLELCSGGAKDPLNARLWVTQAVGDTFTAEWIVKFNNLPNDFTNLTASHIYLGATDAQGALVGLFFSAVGVAYTGSVSFSGGTELQLDTTFQQLPGSSAYINDIDYWVIRAAVSYNLGIVYLYMTKLSDVAVTGHQLRAILPVIPYTAAAVSPVDQVIASVRGTAATPSCAFLDSMCLGSSLIIPNLAPDANAGLDQAVRLCSIAQLDGSSSFDPEGASLGYSWRLVEGPADSEFVEQVFDGVTVFSASGFVTRIFSQALGVIDAGADPLEIGDVINVRGEAYTIAGKGYDGGDFYLQISEELIPHSMSAEPFKYLRQRGISGPTTVNPTFYPSVPGFYAFDLIVHDGQLSSSPSLTIVNVLESPLPRGCTPDLTFMFSYLSDFWKLVEDRDRIAVFWSAVAQGVATELFTLWQYEYSKSLRDIQRTFVRRWLHYDLLLPEPLPELTRVRALYGGVETSIFGTAIVQGDVLHIVSEALSGGEYLYTMTLAGYVSPQELAVDLQAKLQDFADSRFTTQVITESGALPSVGSYLTDIRSNYSDGMTFTLDDGINPPLTFEIDTVGDGVAVGNVQVDISLLLPLIHIASVVTSAVNAQEALGNINITALTSGWTSNFTNTVPGEGGNKAITDDGSIPGTFTGMSSGTGGSWVRVEAPFPFTVGSLTTSALFTIGDDNHAPSGTAGAGIGARTYKVEVSLEGLDLQEDDFLSVDGVAYRISSVLDNPADALRYQRIVVKEDLFPAPSANWSLSGWVSSELLDFWGGLVTAGDYADLESSGQPTGDATADSTFEVVTCRVLGVSPLLVGRAAIDVWPLGARLVDPDLQVLLIRVLRRTYAPISNLVVDVPTLQELIVIEDDEATLRRNVDYFLEEVRDSTALRFSSGQSGDMGDVWEGERPPTRLWAEYTYINNNPLIEANFGLAAGFTQEMLAELPTGVDYLSAVRGLWYAFYNGPTLKNLRIGIQILLGLPFAEQAGTIEEIRTDFSSTQGRILIRDTDRPEIVRSYNYPKVLAIEENPSTGVPYVAGDVVEQFAPLIEGAEVVDWVKDPEWFEGLINQGIFYEVEKFHKFLVRVEEAAFDLDALLFAQNFVLTAKPTYTYPLFFVRLEVQETEVSITDNIEFFPKLILSDGPCEYLLGASWHWDQARAAGGGWRNQYDQDSSATSDLKALLLYDDSEGTYTDYFSTLGDPILDVPLIPTQGVIEVNDAIYLGIDDPCDEIAFDITLVGIGPWVITWEYWDGTSLSWLPLPGVTDGTNSFKVAGTNSLTFTLPSSASTTQVNGSVPVFFIRGRVTTGGSPTQRPEADTIAVAGAYAPPVFPTPDSPIQWGYDKAYLCPQDSVSAIWCELISGSFVPFFDGPFAYDTPVAEIITFEDASPASIPAGPAGFDMTNTGDATVDFTGSLTQLRFLALGDPDSDSETRAALLYDDDLATYTDYTAEALSVATDDVVLLPPSGDIEVGDLFLLGFLTETDHVWFDISTAGVGAWVLTWEYWNGAAWLPLAGVTDGTNGFKTAGVNALTFTKPINMAKRLEDGKGPFFYIRARVTTGDAAPTTRPLGKLISPMGTDYEVVVENVTAVTEEVEAFSAIINTEIVRTLSLAVTSGDVVNVRVRPASNGARTPDWSSIKAYLTSSDSAMWTYDQSPPLGDGVYCIERALS
jgi:hypothetical protein